MPANRGAPSRSRLDLTDPENVRDAAHELRHCLSDLDFARWANRWAQAAIDRCESTASTRPASAICPIEERLL